VYDQKEVKCHINVNGMAMTYTRWVYHGEAFGENESNSKNGEHGDYEVTRRINLRNKMQIIMMMMHPLW
jgi:hypothetical protein